MVDFIPASLTHVLSIDEDVYWYVLGIIYLRIIMSAPRCYTIEAEQKNSKIEELTNIYFLK